MPFDWREREELVLEQRYAGRITADRRILGAEHWSKFIGLITPMERLQADRETTTDHEDLISTFRDFLDAIDSDGQRYSGEVSSTHPLVFVSHQRSDIAEAERIAEIACKEGLDYWLDIHDPLLKLATQIITPSDARYPFIIAAIIEMALLNSSYLIAVHTTNTLASKWVPYELGRVRDHSHVKAANAGGWFHPHLLPRQCGDYVHLCKIARGGEVAVRGWLNKWAGGRGALPWRGNPTRPLP